MHDSMDWSAPQAEITTSETDDSKMECFGNANVSGFKCFGNALDWWSSDSKGCVGGELCGIPIH